MSRADPWNAPGMRSPSPISAARGFQIAGKRSATGRAEGGSILPRRILVHENDNLAARRLLTDAGLAHELRDND